MVACWLLSLVYVHPQGYASANLATTPVGNHTARMRGVVSGRRHALANARTYVPDNTMRQLLLLFTSCAICSAAAPTMDCIRLALDGLACPAGTVLAAVSKPGLRIVGRSFAAAAAAAREFCGVAREAASFRIGEAHLKSGLRSSGHKLKLMFPRASSGHFLSLGRFVGCISIGAMVAIRQTWFWGAVLGWRSRSLQTF